MAESPWVMVVPMVFLAVPSVLSGFLANPVHEAWGFYLVPIHWFSELMASVAFVEVHTEAFDYFMAIVSTVVALAGIGLAYLMYYKRQVDPERVSATLRPLYNAAYRKYYFDEMYEDWITRRGFYSVVAGGTDWIDRNIIDRVGNSIGFLGRNLGRVIATLETGQVQAYGAGISVGVVFILGVFLIWN